VAYSICLKNKLTKETMQTLLFTYLSDFQVLATEIPEVARRLAGGSDVLGSYLYKTKRAIDKKGVVQHWH